MAVCLLSGRKSKLVVDRYIVQSAVTIPSHNKNEKQNKTKEKTHKQNKPKHAAQNKPRRGKVAGSYVTSVMSKRDILVSSLVLVWQVKQRQNRKHKHHRHRHTQAILLQCNGMAGFRGTRLLIEGL